MNVLGLVASPRKIGNGNIIVNEILKGALDNGAKTAIYHLNDLEIKHCQACKSCGPDKDCVLSDDNQEVQNALLDADVLIFAIPIYFGQMSSLSKTFIDRLYSIARNPSKSLDGKRVLVIFTHGAPSGTYAEYLELSSNIFKALGFELIEGVDEGGYQEKGSLKEDSEELAKFRKIGAEL